MTKPEKKFDCIQIKRDAQEKIYETIKEMTPEEEIAYFRRSVNESKFSPWWNSTRSSVEISETR